jgi:hypothetical protein
MYRYLENETKRARDLACMHVPVALLLAVPS